MSNWSIPSASYRVQQLFANLPENRQYDVFILTQLLPEIVST